MRTFLRAGLVTIAVGGLFGGGVVVGMLLDDGADTPVDAGISEVEHDRLLTTCLAWTSDPPRCPAYINRLVEAIEADGGGYREAAEAMEAVGED